MKICHITAEYPPMIGGISKHVYELSQEQAKHGHDVTIYCPDDIGDISKVKLHKNINVVFSKSFGRPLNNPIVPSMFFKLIRNKFDIVHAHDHFFFGSMIAASIKKKKNNFVITHHTNPLNYNNLFLRIFENLYLNLIGKKILKKADKVIVANKYNKTLFKTWNTGSIKIIPNAVNFNEFNKANGNGFRKKFKIPKDKKISLSIGRYAPRKGFGYLFDAIKELKKYGETVNKAIFVLVTTRTDVNKLKEKTKKLGISKHLIILNNHSRKDTIGAFYAADIFTSPSISESFGVTLLEAIYVGLPVVCSDIPSYREILKYSKNHIIVKPRDYKALAEALHSMLKKDIKKNISLELRNEIINKHSVQKIREITQKVYGEVIKCK